MTDEQKAAQDQIDLYAAQTIEARTAQRQAESDAARYLEEMRVMQGRLLRCEENLRRAEERAERAEAKVN